MVTVLLIVIYIAYISLGLPDEIFGSAWPVMHTALDVPLSAAGLFTLTIGVCCMLSSFLSGKIIFRFGTAKVTLVSIVLTVAGLFAVSFVGSFPAACFAAIPLGLGSGCIDAALNSFVALHFASRHMNWLHCSWGIGATTGPALMSLFIKQADGWRAGYRVIACIQLMIAVIVLVSMPLWKRVAPKEYASGKTEAKSFSYKTLLAVHGVKTAMLAFILYCGMEYLCGVWGATYFVSAKGLAADTAARMVSTFYFGITVGRLVSGFLTIKVSNKGLVFSGCVLLAAGIAAMLLPVTGVNMAAYTLMGLGCAPMYPCLMHSTPQFFGEEKAPSIIGMQMASAGLGGMLLPPLFGLLAQWSTVSLMPVYILCLFAVLVVCVISLYHIKSDFKPNDCAIN